MKKSTFNTKYFVIAGLIGLMSGPATAAVPHTFAAGDTIKSSEMNDNFTTIDNDITNISLEPGPQGPIGVTGATGPAGADGQDFSPVGASVGDIMYWDGSVWQLTPAPTTVNATALTLCGGKPIWATGKCYSEGDTGPAGGIVFYITDGGAHGLEAAPADQSAGAQWGCYGTPITGADGTATGTGAQNTADIIAGCGEASIAAQVADAYTLNGYDDWFLPSKDELNLLYLQKDVVGGFAGGYYWSSSEDDSGSAWYQVFDVGFQSLNNKGTMLRVRAVRAF